MVSVRVAASGCADKAGGDEREREVGYCVCCINAHCTLYAAITITECCLHALLSSQQAGGGGGRGGEEGQPDVQQIEGESDEVESGGEQTPHHKAAEGEESDGQCDAIHKPIKHCNSGRQRVDCASSEASGGATEEASGETE